jgi:hypothetical protein
MSLDSKKAKGLDKLKSTAYSCRIFLKTILNI